MPHYSVKLTYTLGHDFRKTCLIAAEMYKEAKRHAKCVELFGSCAFLANEVCVCNVVRFVA